ncbi:BhlA/UviB family holin-like peptide [Paenibacillus camelliae]|uniref:BhlA/UviB family holin-like peptide n=1 Tax=Paenibacillus camelliae TaxID=512410 RepID=UPI0020405A24|nr:BhlA/UviB family holin-like peptide [Paenibacillus camelliae]MCM3632920.1 BhlA/UviB family holin-like peptide [Paenibacillus camelliae]
MVDKLFEVGVAQGLGIFFFLFIAVGAAFWLQNKTIMKQNDNREARYIATIDKLAESFQEVASVNQNVAEMRKELSERNNRQDQMLGRILDRLPIKMD